MSRSRRKTPMSTFAASQKQDKRKANRVFRRKSKQAIRTDLELPKSLREVSDVWGFNGDGKKYWGYDWKDIERIMRK